MELNNECVSIHVCGDEREKSLSIYRMERSLCSINLPLYDWNTKCEYGCHWWWKTDFFLFDGSKQFTTYSMAQISQRKWNAGFFFCFNFLCFFSNYFFCWINHTLLVDRLPIWFFSLRFNRAVTNFPLPSGTFFGVLISFITWAFFLHKDHVNVLCDKIVSQTFTIL